jgi:hypothetical protein
MCYFYRSVISTSVLVLSIWDYDTDNTRNIRISHISSYVGNAEDNDNLYLYKTGNFIVDMLNLSTFQVFYSCVNNYRTVA